MKYMKDNIILETIQSRRFAKYQFTKKLFKIIKKVKEK